MRLDENKDILSFSPSGISATFLNLPDRGEFRNLCTRPKVMGIQSSYNNSVYLFIILFLGVLLDFWDFRWLMKEYPLYNKWSTNRDLLS